MSNFVNLKRLYTGPFKSKFLKCSQLFLAASRFCLLWTNFHVPMPSTLPRDVLGSRAQAARVWGKRRLVKIPAWVGQHHFLHPCWRSLAFGLHEPAQKDNCGARVRCSECLAVSGHFRSSLSFWTRYASGCFHDGIKISCICFCVSNCVIRENVFQFKIYSPQLSQFSPVLAVSNTVLRQH